ncbi:MAG: hypothetical protein Q9M46_07050 [Ghiorsea sp.]|nr:hypothetical protein [Ghiorsea sp.]
MRLMAVVFITFCCFRPAMAHVPQCSAFGAYTDLIQTVDCPADVATYGQYNDYGYYAGGVWCGQDTSAGFWVYNYPTWHIYQTQVTQQQESVQPKQTQPLAQPRQTQTAETQPKKQSDASEWALFMQGKHLLYMKTTAYYRNKWHFWLCSDQKFHYSGEGGAVDVGASFSAASQGSNSGKWQVKGETLVLRYGNGDVEKYDLSYSDDTLYLNGRRYFVVENTYCD